MMKCLPKQPDFWEIFFFMKRIVNITWLILCLLMTSCAAARYAANTAFPLPPENGGHKGTLEEVFYSNSGPGPQERRMFVYLPEGYSTSGRSYPVLYLLHGARGNELSWIEKSPLLHNVDSLTSEGLMKECIIVFPNMNSYEDEVDFGKSRKKGAFESSFEIDGAVESAFMEDVVRCIDSLYRTVPKKDSRAIAGLSIGALQAMAISAAAPEAFGYVGLFSPVTAPIIKKSVYSGIYKEMKANQKLQFASEPQLYWVMIGKYDIFHDATIRFCDELRRKGYSFELYLSKGRHEWKNWENYCNMFMQRLFI